MRFTVFMQGPTTRIGVVAKDDTVRDVTDALETGARDVRALFGLSPSELSALADAPAAREVGSLRDLDIALPLVDPGKIICLGLNYKEHAKEGGYAVPEYPALFLRSRTSLIAANATMVRPRISERLDWEAELLVIIGKGGRHLSEEEALGIVFGYACFNDGSVRDYQLKTHQWTPGKNFDATGAVGPVVVAASALPPGAAGLAISSRLNGRTMQHGNTADMLFPVAKTISLLSEVMTLEPGDLIAMGTPQGVGHARTPPIWMKDGDVVEIEIEGIGILRTPVADEARIAAATQ